MLVLEAGRAERHYWRDLWHYRELFAILAWRDVAVRYKQTVIGVAWAVVRPFLTMVVFTIVFGTARQAAERRRRALSAAGVRRHAALVPVLQHPRARPRTASIGNANLIGKVYFPRLIIPAAAAVVALVDFAINLVILFGLHGLVRVRAGLADRLPAGVRRCSPSWRALGPALLHHRAQRQVPRLPLHHSVPRAVRALRLAGRLLERGRSRRNGACWYSLNPVVGVIDGFRWCLLGGESQLYVPGFLVQPGRRCRLPVGSACATSAAPSARSPMSI